MASPLEHPRRCVLGRNARLELLRASGRAAGIMRAADAQALHRPVRAGHHASREAGMAVGPWPADGCADLRRFTARRAACRRAGRAAARGLAVPQGAGGRAGAQTGGRIMPRVYEALAAGYARETA